MPNTTTSIPFGIFLPTQPGFAKSYDHYTEQLDRCLHSNLPALFYQFYVPPEHSGSCEVLPGGHFDLLFPCGSPLQSPIVCGSVLSTQDIPLLPGTRYFGVRLLPIPLAPRSSIPFKEITNRVVPLGELLPFTPASISPIQADTSSFSARISAFHAWFSELNRRPAAQCAEASNAFYRSIHLIYQTRGNLSIARLSEQMDCSTRHFRSLFEEYVGISPKLFCRIIRYQSTINRLLHPSRTPFYDIITEHGYYDQAHFIHEFKRFSTECPTRWIYHLLRKS